MLAKKSPRNILTTLPLPAMSVASFSLRNFDGQMATAHFGKLPTLVQVSVPWFRYRFHVLFLVIGWLIDVNCISGMVSQVFRWSFRYIHYYIVYQVQGNCWLVVGEGPTLQNYCCCLTKELNYPCLHPNIFRTSFGSISKTYLL